MCKFLCVGGSATVDSQLSSPLTTDPFDLNVEFSVSIISIIIASK